MTRIDLVPEAGPGPRLLAGPNSRERLLANVAKRLAELGSDRAVLVIALELDHFAEMSAARGEASARRVLEEVAERLHRRFAWLELTIWSVGNLFAVACEVQHSSEQCDAVKVGMISCFDRPFAAAGSDVFLSASIGLTCSTDSRDEAAFLLSSAQIALAQARRSGGNRLVVYGQPARTASRERFEMTQELYLAVERDELSLDYQPIIELESGDTVAFEALLRWNPPGEAVPPDVFIPLAEESGLIVPIGRWVLAEVVRQWAANRPMRGAEPLGLTVNVSGAQLDHGLGGLGEDLVAAAAALPGRLSVEITESHLALDQPAAVATLARLKELGVGVIVDDFGTGYSSLQYLREFPVDALKIDRSFIEHIHEDDRDHAIVATVIELAHTLGMLAIAEGVETDAQLNTLVALGCDRAQGFYLATPREFGQLQLSDS